MFSMIIEKITRACTKHGFFGQFYSVVELIPCGLPRFFWSYQAERNYSVHLGTYNWRFIYCPLVKFMLKCTIGQWAAEFRSNVYKTSPLNYLLNWTLYKQILYFKTKNWTVTCLENVHLFPTFLVDPSFP